MPKLFIPFEHNSIFQGLDFPRVSKINECDWVLLWNDVNFMEREVIKLAKALGKKTAVLQHGRKGSSRYFPPFNEKIQADRLLVWGDFDKRSLIQAGQDSSRIRVVGTTVLNGLPDRKPHRGTNLVFVPEHWDKEVPENQKVKEELQKLKGVQITTKIIESHNPENYENPLQSHRDSPSHLSICRELLANTDIVVGISESTFELMAQALDIPVVIMEEWEPKTFGGDPRYFNYRRLISQASAKTSLKNLIPTIKEELKNPQRLSAQRAQVVLDEGGPRNSLELIHGALN